MCWGGLGKKCDSFGELLESHFLGRGSLKWSGQIMRGLFFCSCQMGVVMSMSWNRGHWRIAAFTTLPGLMSPHICYPLRTLGCQRSLGSPWGHSMPRWGWIKPFLTKPVFLFVMMLYELNEVFLPCIFFIEISSHNNYYANTIILIFKFECQVCFRHCFIFNPGSNPVR